MLRFKTRLGSCWALGVFLGACASPTPEAVGTRSGVTCQTVADCATAARAVACEQGYCVDSGGHRVARASDAGAGGADGSSNGGGTGATQEAQDASLIDAARPGSGGAAGASSRDRGSRDGAVVRPPEGAESGPTPPPYCVAPCVWEVVKHCIPIYESCVSSPGLTAGDSQSCDATTGWSEYSGFSFTGQVSHDVRHNGVLCSHWVSELHARAAWLSDWSGNDVAIATADGVYCDATFAEIGNYTVNHVTDAGLELGDGGFVPKYHMDRSRPECAAWDSHGFPIRPPCKRVDGATCPNPYWSQP